MKLKRITALLLAGMIMASSATGCGMNKNATVASMGEENITLGLVNFFCRYQQASMDDLYKQYMGEGVWDTSYSGDGVTMADEVKNTTMETVHEMYTLKKHMKDYNIEITEDEKSAIKKVAKEFMDSNSKEALEEMGASTDIVEELLSLYTIKAKMHEVIIAEADTSVSDEEANMRAYSYIKIDYNQRYDQSTYSYVQYTDDEKAAFAQTASLITTALSEGKTLEEASETYNVSVQTGTYDADDSSLEENFKTALDGLAEGEVSSLISTENSYYFARIDADTDAKATESNKEAIIKDKQDKHYNKILEGWQEEDGWTIKEKQLAKIKFDDYFTQTTESTEKIEASTQE